MAIEPERLENRLVTLRFPIISATALAAGFLASCQDTPPPTATTPPVPARQTPVARPTPGNVTAMDVDGFFARQQSGTALIYDARPNFVAGFGKIPGAVNWPAARFTQDFSRHESELNAARKEGRVVVIYCTDSDCPDARALAEKISSRGFDVSVFEGGFADWKAAGLPVD